MIISELDFIYDTKLESLTGGDDPVIEAASLSAMDSEGSIEEASIVTINGEIVGGTNIEKLIELIM